MRALKTFDDTVAAETSDAIMRITKKLDNVLLCIYVSPNLMHLQSVDTAYTIVMSTHQHSKNLCTKPHEVKCVVSLFFQFFFAAVVFWLNLLHAHDISDQQFRSS